MAIDFPVYFYFIVVSFLASLRIFFIADSGYPYLRTFPVFLFVTILVETTGLYLAGLGKANLLLYNLFSVLGCCYFLWVISRMISSRLMKKVIRVTIVLYTLISVCNIFLVQKGEFHTVTYSLGCLVVVYFSIFFFLQLFRNPKSVNLNFNPDFWICTGILFWYSCGFPLYGFINYWSTNSPMLTRNFDEIVSILNIFLYSLFTIAFLCLKPRKYISSPL